MNGGVSGSFLVDHLELSPPLPVEKQIIDMDDAHIYSRAKLNYLY